MATDNTRLASSAMSGRLRWLSSLPQNSTTSDMFQSILLRDHVLAFEKYLRRQGVINLSFKGQIDEMVGNFYDIAKWAGVSAKRCFFMAAPQHLLAPIVGVGVFECCHPGSTIHTHVGSGEAAGRRQPLRSHSLNQQAKYLNSQTSYFRILMTT